MSNSPNQRHTRVETGELADALGVKRSSLRRAVHRGYKSDGEPVCDWVVHEDDEISHFWVPVQKATDLGILDAAQDEAEDDPLAFDPAADPNTPDHLEKGDLVRFNERSRKDGRVVYEVVDKNLANGRVSLREAGDEDASVDDYINDVDLYYLTRDSDVNEPTYTTGPVEPEGNSYSGPADQPEDPMNVTAAEGSKPTNGTDTVDHEAWNKAALGSNDTLGVGERVRVRPPYHEKYPEPGRVVDVTTEHKPGGTVNIYTVKFPDGTRKEWMGLESFVRAEDAPDRAQDHRPSNTTPSGDSHGGTEQETDKDTVPGNWTWEKDYVYSPAQEVYFFHLSDYDGAPYVLSADKLRSMVQHYSKHHGTRAWKLDEVAAEAGIPADAWREIKQKLNVTHDSPPYLPEDFEETDDVKGMAVSAVQSKKYKWKEEFQREDLKELRKDAKKWRQIHSTLEKAEELRRERTYDPPKLNVRLTSTDNLEGAALVANAQDYHLGNRPAYSGLSPEAYADALLSANKRTIERAARVGQIERAFVVIGGDLMNVDNAQAETTRGTPQDQQMSTSELLVHTEFFSRDLVNLFRPIADTVELIPVKGNHDRVLSQAVFQMLASHFEDTDDVIARREFKHRQFRTWEDRFLVFTHGDYKKKIARRLPQICINEAGRLVASHAYATIHSGHLHHEKIRFDRAGWVHQQAPAPTQLDDYHDREAYSGTRQALQNTLHLSNGCDQIINETLKNHTEGVVA